uniref:Uncharacterized protein n=1 Tax=Amphimedon queenslandica TaxID=400682 RepID=A0A1X7TFZ8_AMPQE
MARQYNVEEALDLVMDDESHEVYCPDSDDELGFEDDDKCITDCKWTNLLEQVYVAELTKLVGPAVPVPPHC